MTVSSGYPDKAPVVNALLDTLSHPVRREVIDYFEGTSESEDASLADIVGYLDARMAAESDEELRITLSHTHLPKLESRGWINYDPGTGRIVYQGHEDAKELLSEVHAIF